MPAELPLYPLGDLPAELPEALPELVQTLREPLERLLAPLGYEHLRGTGRCDGLLLTAEQAGAPVLFFFPPLAEQGLEVQALRAADVEACTRSFPGHAVVYVALLLCRSEGTAELLGPLRLREAGGDWLREDATAASLLPPTWRRSRERFAPLLGGAAHFKLQRVLLPYLAEQGSEAQFVIRGMEGVSPCAEYRVRQVFPTPSVMLLERLAADGSAMWSRPVFYEDAHPVFTAELAERRADGASVLLRDVGGQLLEADCLEALLCPEALRAGASYRWTLALVAERAERLPQSMVVQPAGSDGVTAEVGQMELVYQPQGDSYTLLGGRVRSVESVSVAACPLHRLVMALPQGGDELVVLLSAEHPTPVPGDWVLVRGYLYAAPDALVAGALSEAEAASRVARALASRDWEGLRPLLAEDFAYRSALRGVELHGADAFVRYMRERQDEWERQTGMEGISFETGTLSCRGRRRACCMTCYFGRRDSALVLRTDGERITSAETLPDEDYASFEPTPSPRPEGVFMPYATPMQPHPAALSPLQRFALQFLEHYLRRRLGVSERYGDGRARWVQVLRDEPSFCDMAFQYGAHVFAIVPLRTEQHPSVGGDPQALVAAMAPELRELLLQAAVRYDLVPCIFPVQPGLRLEDGCNLWDMRTGAPVDPEQMPPAEHRVFDWDAFLEAEQVVTAAIAQQGGHVLSSHNTPEVYPHLWFRNAEGQLGSVIVRTHWSPEPPDCPLSTAEAAAATACAPCYVAEVGLTAPDGASRPRRGERHLYYFRGLRAIDRPEG